MTTDFNPGLQEVVSVPSQSVPTVSVRLSPISERLRDTLQQANERRQEGTRPLWLSLRAAAAAFYRLAVCQSHITSVNTQTGVVLILSTFDWSLRPAQTRLWSDREEEREVKRRLKTLVDPVGFFTIA